MNEISAHMPAIEVTLPGVKLAFTNIPPDALLEVLNALPWTRFLLSGQLPPPAFEATEEGSLRIQLANLKRQVRILSEQLSIYPSGRKPADMVAELEDAERQMLETEKRIDGLHSNSPPV